jgi:putative membrane protein
MIMSFTKKHLLASSFLALGMVHCGGGSTPPSNTPEAPTSGSEMSGDARSSQSMSSQSMSPQSTDSSAAGMSQNGMSSDEMPENSGAHSAMNLNDQQIAQVVANVHSAEIEQARVAQKKTNNEQVRQLATMMIQDHTRAQQQEAALNLGKEESPLSERLSTQSQAMLQALRSKQGEEFDRAYIQSQIVGHQQALDAIQNELRPNAQNPELQAYLQQLQPKIAQHIEHARQAQQSLQSSTTSPASSSTARSK